MRLDENLQAETMGRRDDAAIRLPGCRIIEARVIISCVADGRRDMQGLLLRRLMR
jgi:hypothetical protein